MIENSNFISETARVLMEIFEARYKTACAYSRIDKPDQGELIACSYQNGNAAAAKPLNFDIFIPPKAMSGTAAFDLISCIKRKIKVSASGETVIELVETRPRYDFVCRPYRKSVVCDAPHFSYQFVYSPHNKKISIHDKSVSYYEARFPWIKSLFEFLIKKTDEFIPANF